MPGPRPFRVRAKPLVVLAALLAVVVAAERLHWFGRLRSLPEPSLVWIWRPVPPSLVEPTIFFLASDFELARTPPEARLAALGDPAYVVYLNGERVGSGDYRPDAPLDLFAVGPKLRPGTNRVVLELRSPIGSGGATLRIEDGSGRTLLSTGEGWHYYPKFWRGLFEGAALWGRTNARVLGSSPLGRWGRPDRGPERPLFGDAVDLSAAVRARAFRLPLASRHWISLGGNGKAARALGGLVEFDFGEPVRGYLHLDFTPGASAPALLRFANRPAESVGWLPDEIVIPDDSRSFWQDVVPRGFRYVEVVGLKSVRGAAVLPVREPSWLALSSRPPWRGLLGVSPPAVRYPVADGIWKEYIELPLAPVPEPGDVLKPGGAKRRRALLRALDGRRRREGR